MTAIYGPPPGKPELRMWDAPEMRAALAQRDFRLVYRLLQRVGYTQQRIAAMTGQSQPEVSAIINGRKVMAIDVIERIMSGLGAPPAYAGLACRECKDTARTPAEPTPPPSEHTGHDTDPQVWDRLNRFAAEYYPGATPSAALTRLLAEHEATRIHRKILAAYTRLQNDAAAWADYLAELEEWDDPPTKTAEPLPTITTSTPGPHSATDEGEAGREV
jgi:transcriptional regulator with XRE-family HTH domain